MSEATKRERDIGPLYDGTEGENALDDFACWCGLEGPDAFGNYDLLDHPCCPIHGEENK